MDTVVEYLRVNGPSLTSEIAENLISSEGISPEAARKRVSRSRVEVKRLGFLVFPRKARFVYLPGQFGSDLYWSRLVAALQSTNSAYGYAIAAVRARGDIVPEAYFPIVSGAPVRQARHLSSSLIAARLEDIGLFRRITIPGVGPCIALAKDDEYYRHIGMETLARLTAEDILLTAVRDWAKKLGLVSYDRVAVRSREKLATVGTFAWDLTAPTYLGGMSMVTKSGKSKPGFLVADVLLSDAMAVQAVEPFVRKCTTLRALRNVGPCLQMFVAERYTRTAFQLLKKHGIIPATPRTLFGKEVAEALTQVASVLTNVARHIIDQEKLDEIFRRLGKIEGAATQLRGTLFEFMAAAYWRRGADNVALNRIYKVEEGEAEADIVVVRNGVSVTFVECKGYSPYATVPDEQVLQWLQVRIPRLYKYARQHPEWSRLHIHFELWTSGKINDDMVALVSKAKAEVKSTRYALDLKLGSDVLAAFESRHEIELAAAFEKHFVPLAQLNDESSDETLIDEAEDDDDGWDAFLTVKPRRRSVARAKA